MSRFLPDMYRKDVYSINYKKLKEKGIKALLFDFDNTITEKGSIEVSNNLKKLFATLKKDFTVYIVSNSINSKKLNIICSKLDIPYIGNSAKPFKRGYKKLKLNLTNNEIAMIGDQLITDVWGANRMGYFSILIDPISEKEWIITKFNRLLENTIFKRINKKRGSYYD